MGYSEVTEDKLRQVGVILNDNKRPLKERFRALFCLKNLGGEIAINEIAKCFDDESSLLKHELAYCLGQMKDDRAIPILVSLLKNCALEDVVRHEAAEALGAIGNEEIVSVLEEFSSDPAEVVAETCIIASNLINFSKENSVSIKSNYSSIDPAPPYECMSSLEATKIYNDYSESMFNRYRAMFTLRNFDNHDAVKSLIQGFKDKSALFRHEVAFVLGQMKNPIAIGALSERLEDLNENEMVRHEAAEALGAIGTMETTKILQKYLCDSKPIVKESCEVALDIAEYENSGNFQYADTLNKID